MKKHLVYLTAISVFAVGCQKGAGPLDITDTGVGVQNSCLSGPTMDAQIEGAANLKSGQKGTLSLSSQVNCQQAESAHWKIGDIYMGQGTAIQAEIRGSGIYTVAALLGRDSNDVGSAQRKTVVQNSATSQIAVTESQILLMGPQAGYEDQPYQFSLVVPEGTSISEALWDMGDGSPVKSSSQAVTHAFPQGTYTITVSVKEANNQVTSVSQTLTVLPVPERFCPLETLAISGPVEVPVDRRTTFSVVIPDCLKSSISTVTWNFGDNSSPVKASTVQHTFTEVGNFTVTASLVVSERTIVLTREVVVSENLEVMPGPVEPPDVVNPKICLQDGATRLSEGVAFSETLACGLDGSRSNSYKEQITETCQLVGESLEWVETSRVKNLITEGECLGQSCELSTSGGSQILKDGESRVLYKDQAPAGSCLSVQETRACLNGILSGSSAAQHLSCKSGCGEFGSHGTEKTAVVTGEIKQATQCAYNEEGIFSLFNQVSDLSCDDGQILSKNTRQGDIKTAGVCPTYSYAGTESWGACSAACGGVQSRVYECRSNSGSVAPSERCQGAAPVETRFCDGNPESVKRTEVVQSEEQAPASSAVCPKNQIGVVVQKRQVTTTHAYACVGHQVQIADTQIATGAWIEDRYCRDLVPSRCSHDSLSASQAKGRLDWMRKCQGEIPAVQEFLAKFDDVRYHTSSIDEGSRLLYPTFMSSATRSVWFAPNNVKAGCKAPPEVYVAAVCVASCSTPEQQILVQAENEKAMKYQPFIDALAQNMSRVATLHSGSTLSSKMVTSTKVDNWVTELMDTDHEILVFTMKSGGVLKVTTNHPMLSEKGVMRIAKDFQVGDSLVRLGGALDPILSIEKIDYHGKVYNVFVKSNSLKKNVVVINGYLNGTAFYQNEGAKFMNRALFREQLFRGAFDGRGNK